MNRKELTRTFMVILNLKNPLAYNVFIKTFSALRVKGSDQQKHTEDYDIRLWKRDSF